MAGDITLQAGSGLRALFGHTICVAGQDLQLGADGVLRAPAAAADILLAQAGWARQQAPPDKAPAPADSELPAKRRSRAAP